MMRIHNERAAHAQHPNTYVLLEWRGLEVLVHVMGTFQQFFKVLEANGQ